MIQDEIAIWAGQKVGQMAADKIRGTNEAAAPVNWEEQAVRTVAGAVLPTDWRKLAGMALARKLVQMYQHWLATGKTEDHSFDFPLAMKEHARARLAAEPRGHQVQRPAPPRAMPRAGFHAAARMHAGRMPDPAAAAVPRDDREGSRVRHEPLERMGRFHALPRLKIVTDPETGQDYVDNE